MSSIKIGDNIYTFLSKIGKGVDGELYLFNMGNGMYVSKVTNNNKYGKKVDVLEKITKNVELANENCIFNLVDYSVSLYGQDLNKIFKGNEDLHFFIYKYMENDAFNLNNKYSIEISKNLIENILTSIKYLHDNGITHGEIYPCNIYHNENKFKLVDYGFLDEITEKFILINNDYLSKLIREKNSDDSDYDNNGLDVEDYKNYDLFCFGIILYYYFNKKFPFEKHSNYENNKYKKFGEKIPVYLINLIENLIFNPALGVDFFLEQIKNINQNNFIFENNLYKYLLKLENKTYLFSSNEELYKITIVDKKYNYEVNLINYLISKKICENKNLPCYLGSVILSPSNNLYENLTERSSNEYTLMVSKFIRGVSFSEIKDEKYSLKLGVVLLRNILNAIKFLHENGVAHRNINFNTIIYNSDKQIDEKKLETNILDNNFILTDFELSCGQNYQSIQTQNCNKVVGLDHLYINKKLLNGEIDPDFDEYKKNDLYSLGVVLYYYFNKKYPYNMKKSMFTYKYEFGSYNNFTNSNISKSMKNIIHKLIVNNELGVNYFIAQASNPNIFSI